MSLLPLKSRPWIGGLFIVALFATGAGVKATTGAISGKTIPIEELPPITSMEIDKTNPDQLYVATTKGIFLTSPHATATRVSEGIDNLSGFAAHPDDSNVFYATVDTPGYGDRGVIRSDDGGRSWSPLQISTSVSSDIHILDVNKADPNVIYGVGEEIVVSRDGGRTWSHQGKPPGKVFDLASSAADPDTAYLATTEGLLKSMDAGKSWQGVNKIEGAATMVFTVRDGPVYAVIEDIGLIKALEPSLAWTPVSDLAGNRIVRHFSVDPDDLRKMYIIDNENNILVSVDAGESWKLYGS